MSPIKSLILRAPLTTPSQRHSPLPPFSGLKGILGENDIFAISPAIFPSKTKRVDYLDFLADAERKDFISPVKAIQERATASHALTQSSPPKPTESEEVANNSTKEVDVCYDQHKLNDSKTSIDLFNSSHYISCGNDGRTPTFCASRLPRRSCGC